MRRWMVCCFVALAGAGVMPARSQALLTKPAVADPLEKVIAEQAPLADAADHLMQLEGARGFGSVVIDNDSNQVRIYWKGQPSDELLTRVADVRESGVVVSIVQAQWSASELDAEVRRLGAQILDAGDLALRRIGPSPDMTHIEVDLAATDLVRARDLIRSALPLEFVSESNYAPVAGRWDDTAPFYSGLMMDYYGGIFQGYSYCTGGFAVRHGDGTEGLITANHCGASRDWYTPLNDQFIGTSGAGSSSLDATTVTGGDYYPRMYGSDTHLGSTSRIVQSSANPAVGALLRASGAASGAEVVEVVSVLQYLNSGGTLVRPGFETLDPEGDASIGSGDSGGPIARPIDDTYVAARGMIDSIDISNTGTCQGSTVPTGRQCSPEAFHINISAILNGLGLTIQTG